MPSAGLQPGQRSTRTTAAIVMAVLAASQLIIAIDYNIVYVALPSIAADLGFTTSSVQWVVSAYALTFGGFLLLGGRLSDLLSKRALFVFALVLYAGGSIAGGLSESQALLIAARMTQGLGGALLFPATLSIISTTFAEGKHRNKALAIWGAAGASGGALGALFGGLITSSLGWRWTFFIIVPVAVLVALLALRFLPSSQSAELQARSRRRLSDLDLPGSLTVTLGSLSLVFALATGPQTGWGSPLTVAAFISAACLFLIFAVIETRTKNALMPFRMFRNRNLRTSAILAALFMASFGGQFFLLTTWLQDVRGLAPLTSGLAVVPLALAIVVGTNVGSRLVNRLGARAAAAIGLGIGLVSLAAIGLQLTPAANYFSHVLPWLVLDGLGQGITWTAMWIAASTGVRPTEQGVASGITSTAQQVGGAVGLAVLVAITSAPAATAPSSAEGLNNGLAAAFGVAAAIAGAGAIAALIGLPSRRKLARTATPDEVPAKSTVMND